MKFKTPALALIAAFCIAFSSSGCFLFHHHQPKSSFKIVDVGDDSPFIVDAPTRAGTVTRNVDAGADPRRQPRPQQQQQDQQQYQLYQQSLQQQPAQQVQPQQQYQQSPQPQQQ